MNEEIQKLQLGMGTRTHTLVAKSPSQTLYPRAGSIEEEKTAFDSNPSAEKPRWVEDFERQLNAWTQNPVQNQSIALLPGVGVLMMRHVHYEPS